MVCHFRWFLKIMEGKMKKIKEAKNEMEIRLATSPNATREEVKKAMCSCVNHLCGCDN